MSPGNDRGRPGQGGPQMSGDDTASFPRKTADHRVCIAACREAAVAWPFQPRPVNTVGCTWCGAPAGTACHVVNRRRGRLQHAPLFIHPSRLQAVAA